MNITRKGFSPATASCAGVVSARINGNSDAQGETDEDQLPQCAKGKVTEIVKGATASHIRIDIGGGVIATPQITNEAVASCARKGKQAYAVIKASDVMVGIAWCRRGSLIPRSAP